MNTEYCHFLENKVTQSVPAVFADNLTMFTMNMVALPWKMHFSNDKEYTEFIKTTGLTILFVINKYLHEWNEPLQYDPFFWSENDVSFSKLLYSIRMEFIGESLKTKTIFLSYCVKMLYYSLHFYDVGLSEAPTKAFIEVYRLTCIYYREEFLS